MRRSKIFISYRRSDTMQASGRLHDHLIRQFGKQTVLKDIDSVPAGADVHAVIPDAIRQTALLVVVIGRHWQENAEASSQRSLDDPVDLVRQEIALAFQQGVPILPVLIEQARMPAAEDLPEDIQQLSSLQAVVINDDPDFLLGVQRLIRQMNTLLPSRLRPATRYRRYAFAALSLIIASSLIVGFFHTPWVHFAGKSPAMVAVAYTGADTLNQIDMLSTTDGWAVGGTENTGTTPSTSVILHYAAGKWMRVLDPATLPLATVAMVSPTEGWAAGGLYEPPNPGVLLHYVDGQWHIVPMPVKARVNSIAMISADEGWAVGGTNDYQAQSTGTTILHYLNGTWSIVPVSTHAELNSVTMISATEGWAVGENGTILHYLDGVWNSMLSPAQGSLNHIEMLSRTEGWIGGGLTQSTILHYANGAWSAFATPAGKGLWSIAMLSASEGWAVGNEGTIYHYLAGQGWTHVISPVPNALASVAFVSPFEGWIVGNDGVIIHYVVGAWTPVASPTLFSLNSIAMASATEGWAVGDNGTIVHDQHGVWSLSPDSVQTASDLASVTMLSATNGWAVGDRGTILHYTPLTGWALVASPTKDTLVSISMISATDGWAIGNYYQSVNDGLTPYSDFFHYDQGTWKSVAPPVQADLHAIDMLSATDGWAVGETDAEGGVIYHYDGKSWSVFSNVTGDLPGINTISPLRSITMISSTTGWAGGYGTLLRFQNGQWQNDVSARQDLSLDTSESMAVTLDGDGWAIGIGDFLHHTAYTGWTVVDTHMATDFIDFNAIAMTSATDGWVVGPQGEIWHYQPVGWQLLNG